MADMAELLKTILDDPQTSEKLRSLIGGSSAVSAEKTAPDIDPAMLMKLTKAFGKMSGAKDDSRTRLLHDLKPYVSDARKQRVDKAIEMLKMMWLIEILKDEKE